MNEKRGQVSIFIILGILIVVAVIIILLLVNGGDVGIFPSQEKDPRQYFSNCLEKEIEDVVEKISLQGGSYDPQHYLSYKGDKLEYLCYTNEDLTTGVVQRPMMYQHVKKEIKRETEDKARECFSETLETYGGEGNFDSYEIELLPKRVVGIVEGEVMFEEGEESKAYNEMRSNYDNNLYEMISVSNNIIDSETKLGDAEITRYMRYNRWLKVEKYKQGDGSKVYILSNKNDGSKFQFASRSLSWPPGFGGNVI